MNRTLPAQPLSSNFPIGSTIQYRAYHGRKVVTQTATVVGHPASNPFALKVLPATWPADANPTFVCTAGVKVLN